MALKSEETFSFFCPTTNLGIFTKTNDNHRKIQFVSNFKIEFYDYCLRILLFFKSTSCIEKNWKLENAVSVAGIFKLNSNLI